MTRKNYPKPKQQYKIMDEDTYEFNLKYCKIRPNKNFNNLARTETPWTVEIGIFKDYLKDAKKEVIDKCFEFDWANMKTLKFKKSSSDDIKEEMRRIYPVLREAYKVQAGYSPNGNIFSVGMNQINTFLQDMGCLDQDETGKFKSADADRMFITVNASRSGPTNPAKNLIRLQFMEFFIRGAVEKFFVSGLLETEL
jgi:hypothetical protein